MQRLKYTSYFITFVIFGWLVWRRLAQPVTGPQEWILDGSLVLIMLGVGQQVVITFLALLADLILKFNPRRNRSTHERKIHTPNTDRSVYATGRRSDFPFQRG